MKVIWRFVLGVVCCALVGSESSTSTSALLAPPLTVRSPIPPEVAELLPHAVLLWQSDVLAAPLFPFGARKLELLGMADIDGDGFVDIICSQGDTIFTFKGKGRGRFAEPEISGLLFVQGLNERGAVHALTSAVADLNADGLPDLVVSAVVDDSVCILLVLENERGRFIPKSQRVLPSPAGWLELADLSGDGYLDLVLIQQKEDTYVFCLLEYQGEFSFGDPVPVGRGEGRPFFLGDVNGDGFLDLALLHYAPVLWPDTGFVTLLLGEARGFRKMVRFKPAADLVQGAVFGDLSGDGLPELVAAISGGVVVATYAGEEFMEIGFHGLEFIPHELHIADMDGDGNNDLLVLSVYGRRLAVLSGDGKGSFRGSASEYAPELDFSAGLHLADLDRNGLPDLLLPGFASIAVIMNGGSPRGFSRIPFSGAFALGTGDLSANGFPDLLVQGKQGIEVLWNDGRGAFVRTPLVKFDSPPLAAAAVPGTLYTLTQTRRQRHAPPPIYIEAYTAYVLHAHNARGELIGIWDLGEDVLPVVTIGDLDGDGVVDVVGSKTGKEFGALWVLWGGRELREYPIPGRAALPIAGDFTAAGRDQIAVICIADYADLRLVSFHEREAHVSEVLQQLFAQPMAITTGDFDGDGRPDPVTIAFVLEVQEKPVLRVVPTGAILGVLFSRIGAVTFPIPQFPTGDVPWPFTGLAAGDFTGDGLDDVAFSTANGAGVFILPSQGNGAFGEALVFPVAVGPLFTADLDGNGQADLVASTQGFEPVVWILRNRGGAR